MSTEKPVPRRNILILFTPAETAIWNASEAVEQCGADVRLTEAVNLLSKARQLVADFVDERISKCISL